MKLAEELVKKNRAITIMRNTVANYARQLTQILVFILLTPFIVSKVGADDFGLWSLIQATVGLLGLMDLGFSTSVVKYVADARGRQDEKRLGDLTATLFWIYTGLGLAMMTVAFAIAPILGSLFSIPEDKRSIGQVVFLLIAFRSAQALPLGMFIGVLVGFQRQVVSNTIRSLGTISYALLAWWALNEMPTIEILAAVSAGTGLFWNLVAMTICLRSAKGASISPWRFRRPLVREVTTFSFYFFLIQISLLIATRFDTILIKMFLPLTAVALYSVAIGVVEKASVLCRQLANALTPMIAELKGGGEEKNIRAVLRKGSSLSFAFAAPLLFGLAWYAEDLVVVWMGEEFRGSAWPLRILLAAAIVNVLHSNAETVLTMTGNEKYLAYVMIGGQTLNVVLSIALVGVFGIAGVALATLIAVCTMQFGFVSARLWKDYHCSPAEFYTATVFPSVAGLVPMFAYLVVLDHYFQSTHLLHVAALEGGACVVFFAGYLSLGMSRKDRGYYFERIGSAFNRRKGRSKA